MAIYRPLHATDLPSAPGAGGHFAVLTWEFPLMGKYKFRRERTLRPFAELGPAFRLDGNFKGPTPSHYGMVVGGGIETRIWRLRISPTVRYARWGPPRTPQGGGTFRNEIETLVGLAF